MCIRINVLNFHTTNTKTSAYNADHEHSLSCNIRPLTTNLLCRLVDKNKTHFIWCSSAAKTHTIFISIWSQTTVYAFLFCCYIVIIILSSTINHSMSSICFHIGKTQILEKQVKIVILFPLILYFEFHYISFFLIIIYM